MQNPDCKIFYVSWTSGSCDKGEGGGSKMPKNLSTWFQGCRLGPREGNILDPIDLKWCPKTLFKDVRPALSQSLQLFRGHGLWKSGFFEEKQVCSMVLFLVFFWVDRGRGRRGNRNVFYFRYTFCCDTIEKYIYVVKKENNSRFLFMFTFFLLQDDKM